MQTPARAPMPRSISDLVSGGVLLGVSALFYAQTVGTGFSHDEIARDPVWYPRLLLIGLAAASAGLIARALFGAPDRSSTDLVWPRFLVMAALVGVYFLAFDSVGFLMASLVFFLVTTWLLGYRQLLVTVLVGVLFVVLVWYSFAEIFVIRPPGIGLDDLSGWL